MPMPEMTTVTASASSAAALYKILKDFFLGFCVLHQDLGDHDVLLKFETSYLRLRRTTPRDAVACFGIEIGFNADQLRDATADPEHQFPFDTSSAGDVTLTLSWEPGRKLLLVMVRQVAEAMYRWNYDFRDQTAQLAHQNYHRPGSEPNFLETSTPYIKLGA